MLKETATGARPGDFSLTDREAEAGAEERLIAGIEALWADRKNPAVVLAGGDDCAVVRVPGSREDLLLTSDQVVENRHFVQGKHPPGALGRKALVRSLSDIAAMGGRPSWCLQTVCLPDWARGEWHDEFQKGMRQAAREPEVADLALVGGDVSGGDRFVATVAVVGRVATGTALLRRGATPGDCLYVSGSLGGSVLGLEMLLGQQRPDPSHPAVLRHCNPTPRLALGRALRRVPATAAIDLSDGLAIDARRLANASEVALVIESSALPLFPGASADAAVQSGEEYELLFTLAPDSALPGNAEVTRIGRVERGFGVWLQSAAGRQPLEGMGFVHF